MSDLSKIYNSLISDLDKNIKDEQELNKIKNKLSELMASFADSINNLSYMQEKQDKIDKKFRKIQRRLERIEEDIYIDDFDEDEDEELHDQMHDNDCEFEIRCPYCENDFIISDYAKNINEIECPKCHNIIELDWNDYHECNGKCNHCESNCYEEDEDYEESQDKVAEEDTPYETNKSDKKGNNQNNSKKSNNTKNNENNKKNNNEDDM